MKEGKQVHLTAVRWRFLISFKKGGQHKLSDLWILFAYSLLLLQLLWVGNNHSLSDFHFFSDMWMDSIFA